MDSITVINRYGERFLVRHQGARGFAPTQKPLSFRGNLLDPAGFLSRFTLFERSQLQNYLKGISPSPQAMCYMRPVEQALREGRIKLYPLGKPINHSALIEKANPLYEQLKRVLNRIISAEKAQTAALDDLYNQEDTGTKILINMGALFQGAIDFGVSTAETIKDTAIWAKDVFEVANPHLRAVRLITQLSESSSHPGDIQDKILDFVQKATDRECKELADVIGFDIRKFSISAIKEALTMAAALLGDARTYTILYEFAKRFISAQHHTELLRYGVSMVFQIILGAILFILSGGASIIANIAAIARQVGKLMVELGKVLVDLAKLLVKKIKRKKKGSRRHKGGDTSSGSGSSSNTKSQSEKPLEKYHIEREKTGRKYGPHEAGPLGNPNDPRAPASTFRSGTYTEKIAETDMYFYRDYGGTAKVDGRYWTKSPSEGPLQSQLDSAVLPEWGNTFENKAVIKVQKGTKYYEGYAAPQKGTTGTKPELHGGGVQILLPKPNQEWILK